MSDPYVGAGLSDPVSVDASGVYVKTDSTYTSSIDASLTDLSLWSCYDAGCAAAAGVGGLPVVLGVHGYSGDKNSLLKNVDGERWAARACIFVSVGMRARSPSVLGVRDNRGRETQDIIDALAYIRSTIPYASATKASAVGWSDGGGECLGLRCKSDLFTVTASFFPTSSYTRWYSFWASAPGLLDVDLGGSPTTQPQRYATREISTALVRAQQLMARGSSDGWTYVLHDTGDTIVSSTDSDALDALSPVNWTYTKTTGASTYRALHGHPTDHLSDLPPLEWPFAVSMLTRPAFVPPTSGSLFVLGSYVSKLGIEVWLDDESSTGSPRTNGTGGQDRVSLMAYDTVAGTMSLLPMLGSQRAYVRMGSSVVTEYLAGNTITTFDAGSGRVSRINSDLASAPTSWSVGAPRTWGTGATRSFGAVPASWFVGDVRSRTVIAP